MTSTAMPRKRGDAAKNLDDAPRTDDDARDLARRLRDQRTFLNLSQSFVAEQTGIRRSAISDIERGSRRVASLELKRLADLYRMPVDSLLGHHSGADIVSGSEDPTVQALARAASKMGDEEKEQLLRFAAFLQNYDRPTVGGR
jgi:transcriptional regulator with XRE-family HTH domain